MDSTDVLASVLVDHAIAEAMVPWPCPCDFGPDDRYRLEELIGVGRDSLVYRAHDRRLSSDGFDATVAIKIARTRDGVRHDALSARRISHPNVLAIYDQGVADDGCVYLVAEYIDGGDLSQRPGPWPPRDAAEFMIKVARGVQAAHSAGVVHCDLKPSNIMLTSAGEPKLGDFDLARWVDRPDDMARGNVAFMSPEQFAGHENALTPPSDIYALGGLLFSLLTGRLANGASAREVAATHARGAPPPSPGVERDLDRICQRAMANRREDRYHAAGEFADDLQRWLSRQPIDWTEPRIGRRIRLWALRNPVRAIVSVVGFAAIASTLGVWRYNEVLAAERAAWAQSQAVALADERVDAVSARVRSHVRRIYLLAMEEHNPDRYDFALSALVWMHWLTDFPLMPEQVRLENISDRITMFRRLLSEAADNGRGDHLDVVLTRYVLAYLLIEVGSFDEARELLGEVRERWSALTPADDPFWSGVAAMEDAIFACKAAADGVPLRQVADRLEAIGSRLKEKGDNEAVRRLVRNLAARHAPPPRAEEALEVR